MILPLEDTAYLLNPKLDLAQILNIAQGQILKGDWALVRRLIHLALIKFPSATSQVQELQVHAYERQQRVLLESHAKVARKFDFLILPSLRAGSSLLEQALNLHPESIVVPKTDLDNSLQSGQGATLLHRYRPLLVEDSGLHARSLGLVVHRFLMRKDHIKTVASSLRAIVAGDTFIQIVRNPLEAFISEFNHNFIETLLGDYRFDLIGITAEESKQAQSAVIENAKQKRQEFFANFIANKILYNTIRTEFSKLFSNAICIDFSEFAINTQIPGLKKIFELLKISNNYLHPLFARPSYSIVQRVMERNWFALKFDQFTLNVRIGYAGQSLLLPSAQVVELAHTDSPATDGLDAYPLALCVQLAQWEQLPIEIRQRLIGECVFDKILTTQVLPSWLENWKIWKSLVDPFLISKLEDKWQKEALVNMNDDVSEFAKYEPQLVRKWEW